MHKEHVFQIRQLQAKDLSLFKDLISLFAEVFEEKSGMAPSTQLEAMLSKSEFVAMVIMCKGKIAGGLTAYELPMYQRMGSELFLYDIAVLPAFQRLGLGRQLLSALRDYCRSKGIPDFFVAADESDTHALDFYRAAGGLPARVVHFSGFVS
jgi:aminoglycoside 3-N-acetyltransferase I